MSGLRRELVFFKLWGNGLGVCRLFPISLSRISEPQAHDDRILGRDDFVEKLNEEHSLQDKMITRITLDKLAIRVADHCGIPANDLFIRSRDQQRIDVRDLFCYIAVRNLCYSGTQTGKMLGLQRAAVSHAVKRGSKLINKDSWDGKKILGR